MQRRVRREGIAMRAERDDDFPPVRRATERRLAYEIALGIWLGGMALGLTSFVRVLPHFHGRFEKG
ncbi:hypothetical protein IPC1322_33260 [Pseudomonas aeruginosa]|nr:hypothetical protein IPC1322_33260 [Pseudomonas aeruginosa]